MNPEDPAGSGDQMANLKLKLEQAQRAVTEALKALSAGNATNAGRGLLEPDYQHRGVLNLSKASGRLGLESEALFDLEDLPEGKRVQVEFTLLAPDANQAESNTVADRLSRLIANRAAALIFLGAECGRHHDPADPIEGVPPGTPAPAEVPAPTPAPEPAPASPAPPSTPA